MSLKVAPYAELRGVRGARRMSNSRIEPIITPLKETVCLLSNGSTKIPNLYEDSKGIVLKL